MARGKKKEEIPITTIRLSRKDKQLLRVAAALCNTSYQVFMRNAALAAADQIIRNKSAAGFEFRTIRTRKVTFIDE
jgi:uncharacterized protein (DUF1778 family)